MVIYDLYLYIYKNKTNKDMKNQKELKILYVEKDMHKALKTEALSRDVTLFNLVRELLIDYTETNKDKD